MLELDIRNLPLGTYGGELENGFNWNLNLTRYSVSNREEGLYKRALMQITWKDLNEQQQAVIVEYFPEH